MISITSWNINSIRNKVAFINDFLEKEKPDILFISETKITEKLETDVSKNINSEYSTIWNSNKSGYWHGTCFIYKKDKFDSVNVLSESIESYSTFYKLETDTVNSKKINTTLETDIDNDTEKAHKTEGRVLLCEFIIKETNEKIVVLGTYSPNSGVNRDKPLKRLAYRILRWDYDVYKTLDELKTKYKNVFWVGDLNVAHKQNDMAYKMNIAGTTFEERENFQSFLSTGWIDTFDILNSDKTKIIDRCTYGYNIKCKLRLDYIVSTNEMKERVKSSNIIYGYEEVSDHLPICVIFKT